ncbi:hypothetical protein M2G87_12530 [Vibrio vulnificus]|nr:hypothetical protein [Vibrio vulnificus]MCU8241355.1 hypothetical protein [Vibrio vulnificus]MCU8378325.1 hypothetical protein [Vibrio vulnificus]
MSFVLKVVCGNLV